MTKYHVSNYTDSETKISRWYLQTEYYRLLKHGKGELFIAELIDLLTTSPSRIVFWRGDVEDRWERLGDRKVLIIL